MGINYSEDSSHLVTHVEPIVKYSNYIEFKRGDEVVGKIHAEFDFRDMPEEYHGTALQLIMTKAFTLQLPCSGPVYQSQLPKEEKKEKKWFGLF